MHRLAIANYWCCFLVCGFSITGMLPIFCDFLTQGKIKFTFYQNMIK